MASQYLEGHVKRNPSDSTVAVRTIFPEDEPVLAGQAWLSATTSRGAHFLRTADVDSWDAIYTPTPPAE